MDIALKLNGGLIGHNSHINTKFVLEIIIINYVINLIITTIKQKTVVNVIVTVIHVNTNHLTVQSVILDYSLPGMETMINIVVMR